jgi:hypothetical protein
MKNPRLETRGSGSTSGRTWKSANRRHCEWACAISPSHRFAVSLALFCILTSAFCLCAQAQYALDWWTIDGGGGQSTGGAYSVSGTIGQPDAGRMSGGSFTLEGGFWGILAAIQTEGAPTLAIELTNGWVKVSWPAPAPDWVLTESDRLTSAGSAPWSQVSAAQYQTNAGRIFIFVAPQSVQNRFYQLRRP